MTKYLIGCDVGSQGLMTILCDEKGKIAASAYKDYPLLYPAPAWAEQDARHWIDAITLTIQQVLADSNISGKSIAGLGVASQVDGLVPVGKDGKPLRNAIIWMDRRATKACEFITSKMSPDEIFRLTGLNLDPSHVAPKILWLKENEPEIYEKSRKFLLPGSFVLHHLTGEFAIDHANASSTMLYDIHKRKWSDELLRLTGIEREKLVDIFSASTVVGSLRPEFADKTGLAHATKVIVGTGDEHGATLGAGVVAEGMVCDVAGTAEPVSTISSALKFSQSKLLETHGNCDDSTWFIENPGFVSGGNYRWLRDQLGAEENRAAKESGKDAYAILDEKAKAIPPGAEGLVFLPCMMGAMVPEWNAHARGCFYGLTMKHIKAHMIRAVLEASAYGLRDILEDFKQCSLAAQEIRIVGGGAKSKLWRQIKADVTGVPVLLPEITESTAFGAALLAGIGVGIFSSAKEAAHNTVRIKETSEPQSENKQLYDAGYELYRNVYFALKSVTTMN